MILSCNVRGLNDPSKLIELRHLIGMHRVRIVCLIETRVKESNMGKITRRMGKSWSWVHNYEYSHKRKLWVGWNMEHNTINVSSVSE